MTVLKIENYSIFAIKYKVIVVSKKKSVTLQVFLYSPVPADEFRDADVTLTTSPE